VIIPMSRIRVLGPRGRLDAVLGAIQDTGLVHLAEPKLGELLQPVSLSERESRQARYLRAMVREVDDLSLGARPGSAVSPGAPEAGPSEHPEFARWARTAGRARRELARLDRRTEALERERAELARFEQFVAAFRGRLPSGNAGMQSYHLMLRGEEVQAVTRLRAALSAVLGEGFALEAADLPSGERAALLLVPNAEAPRVEQLLARSGIQEMPLPAGITAGSLGATLPALAARREGLDREIAELQGERRRLLSVAGPELTRARAVAQDRLLELGAREHAGITPRSFVVEGWVPAAARDRLARALARQFGAEVVMEEVSREEWRGEEAPVVLTNPRLFQPFETLTRMLPLPRYGSIDPTPFMAVFFPMFFGLIMGDAGYGIVLAILAAVLHRRSRPGGTVRAVAEIMGPCAAFAIAFGIGFGEFFGDLGRRWVGMRPLVMDREKALLPFLGLTVAIGFVHVALGMVLGIVNAGRSHPRQAVGRGAALVMVCFVAIALLAGVRVLPHGFFTPAVIVILLAFPVLVIAEGIIAPIEFLSTLSNMLSYARIMALGTASVMMAVVANRLAGAFGGVVVGILFGLLFHLVNFALGIFAPAIHGLRLHYVEFFGKFYSPGGQQYHPLGHWRPGDAEHPLPAKGTS